MNLILYLVGATRYKYIMPPRKKTAKLVKKTTVINVARSKRTAKRKSRRNRNRIRTVKIPAAQATRIPRSSFRRVSSKNNEQEIILEGEDLIIPTPDALPTEATSWPIFLSIPANPLYWKGTRVSGIAAVYQQYRPLKFEVEYVPQVPVTCPGQVIYGTLYNKGVSKESFQQTLMTSNGGGMTQCYLKSHSHVICNKKTLPLTLYNTFDSMNENVANPFNWVAHYSGQWSGQGTATTSQPGWVWVKWRYLFSVGLGAQSGEVIVYNQTDAAMAASNSFFAGWGVALSYLKNVAVKLLTKIAIVLLEETEVQVKAGQRALNSKLGIGSTFSVEPDSIAQSTLTNSNTIKVRDDAGNEFDIPEQVRVVVYQNGDTYEVVPEEEDEPQFYNMSCAYYIGYRQTPQDNEYTKLAWRLVSKGDNDIVFRLETNIANLNIHFSDDGKGNQIIQQISLSFAADDDHHALFCMRMYDGSITFFPLRRSEITVNSTFVFYNVNVPVTAVTPPLLVCNDIIENNIPAHPQDFADSITYNGY